MKHFLAPVFLFLMVNFCAAQQTPSLDIEILLEDTLLNVRALEIYEGNPVIASSDGRVMQWRKDQFQLAFPIDTVNMPNFRSLATTNKGIFALGIGSPALLYKNGKIVYREDDEKAFYDAMDFWNDEEGIAMGDPTDGCLSIIITRDGGDTWKKIDCASLPDSKEGEAAFAASDSNIKIVGDKTWIATGGMASRVFYSPDKGITWEVVKTPIIQGSPTTGMYSIDFYNENVGYAIGGDYTAPERLISTKIKTIDGGKTWEIAGQAAIPGYRSCVRYVPGSEGLKLVAVGFKGIDFSADGGETWVHLSDEGFYTIRFVDQKIAIVAGSERIAKLTFEF